MAHLDDDVSICDPEIPENSGASPSLIENEANMSTSGNISGKQKTKEKRRGHNSRTSKKAEMELLGDKMEERMRQNIEARFSSFDDKICGIVSSKLKQAPVSATVTSNTSGGCNSPVRPRANSATNNCFLGASSMANYIPVENSLNAYPLGRVRQPDSDDDVLSIQPGQRERRALDMDSEEES